MARLFSGVSLFPLDSRQTIAGNGVNRDINYQNSASNFNDLSAAYCLAWSQEILFAFMRLYSVILLCTTEETKVPHGYFINVLLVSRLVEGAGGGANGIARKHLGITGNNRHT